MTITKLFDTVVDKRFQALRRSNGAAERLALSPYSSGAAQLEREAALAESLGDFQHYSQIADQLQRVRAELSPYREHGEHALITDLYRSKHGAGKDQTRARERLRANSETPDVDTLGREQRDVGAGSAWSNVPDWLLSAAEPQVVAAAPLVQLLQRPLPRHWLGSANMIGFSTPPVAAPQAAPNAAIASPMITDIATGPAVRTFATRVQMSLQLFDMGREGIDNALIPAMMSAVDAAIESSLVNGDGAAGSLKGIANTSGVSTASYVDATPTLQEFWPRLESLVRQTELVTGGRPILIMSPRRLSWIRERAVTENLAPFEFDEPSTIAGAACEIFGGVSVVIDATTPTTLGAGSNEDRVVVVRSVDALTLLTSDFTVEMGDVASSGLSVYVNVRKYAAFSAERAPAALGVLSGTGLVAPA